MRTVIKMHTSLLKIWNEIGALEDKKDFSGVVDLVDRTLKRKDLTPDQISEFLYYKGTSLDYQNKHFEAVEIFLGLVDRYPYHQSYQTSLRLTLSNIAVDANSLIERDKTNEDIFRYEETLLNLDWCPASIRIHCAILRALSGKGEESKALLKAYLAWNPGDAEFLRGAMKVAEITRDFHFKTEIESQIHSLFDRYPYRVELLEILEEGDDLAAS